MKEFLRKNVYLVMGISIPILMILLVAAFIYLPGLFIHPQYNFLYISGGDSYWNDQFIIQDGRLMRRDARYPNNDYYSPPRDPKLIIYDVANDTNREVSFEEAQGFTYDPNDKSPDGFEVVHGSYSHEVFPFFSSSAGDANSYYISGHNVTNKLELQRSRTSGYGNFDFVGWIT